MAARFAGWLLAALGALLVFVPSAFAEPAPAPELPARAWILVDAEDGDVIAAHRAETPYSIASTTKLMTAYVARRDLELSDEVVAPPYQALAAESLLGLEAGERITVRDLLYGMLLASGNDAAVALADAAAGSVREFVAEMNQAADRLGLEHTSYANPIGLDDPANYSSAHDLATLATVLRRDRLFRRIFDTPETVLTTGARPRDVVNRNSLLFRVPYVNGVKTGYTIDAGNVLVGSATRKGVDLVSAVLGVPTESERDSATLTLLDYGFSLYHRRTPVRRSERLTSAAIRWQDESVPLAATRDVRLTVRRGQQVETRVQAPDEIEGPVERGERVGEVVVSLDSETVATVPLAATRAVGAASLLDRYDAAVPGSRSIAWLLAIAVVALAAIAVVALARVRRR